MTSLAVAVAFLTRVPVRHRSTLAPGALARAALWFPAVGALVGAVLGGTRLAAELALPAGAATVLGLAAAIVLTGGLHEDGLADTADGLGAHVPRERRLEIMRDPRVGTFGLLAVVLVVLLAFSLLASLTAEGCLRAAVAGHVLARWAMLLHAASAPPARPDGAGALLRVTPATLSVATVAAGALVVATVGPAAGAVAAATAIAVAAAASLATRRVIGGATGDTYGAVGKVTEVAAFAAVVAAGIDAT